MFLSYFLFLFYAAFSHLHNCATSWHKKLMGDLLLPKPPQWARKQQLVDVDEDSVLRVAHRLLESLNSEVDPTVTQLAAIQLLFQAVAYNYRSCMGEDNFKEMVRQADELAAYYTVVAPDGTPERQ